MKGHDMAIEFHCQHCGHLIRTGNEHAGKRGKCPHCQNSVYIPTPSDELEPLDLAPVDDADERRQRELLEETRKLTERMLHEKDVPPEIPHTGPRPEPVGDIRLTTANMENLVIDYALNMAAGKLAEADELAEEIHMNMSAAEEVMQRMTLDEIPPPRLAKIPRPVLVGFFKQLRERK
jgi:phage FluMu protein Com